MNFWKLNINRPSGPRTVLLKTEKETLTEEQAMAILHRLPEYADGQNHFISLAPTSYMDACKNYGIKTLTVRDILDDGTVFYREPGETVQITMVRTDENGTQPPLTDLVSVPTFLVEKDCNGNAVRRLFAQIARDFIKKPNAACIFPDKEHGIATWNEFVNIPPAFLKRYGVSITPAHDTMLILEVPMDGNAI